MANESKFSKIHKALRIEVSTKTQRKNKSISRSAKSAAKKMYKMLRPTLVMHLVRGNSLYFKLDENQELLIYVTEGNDYFSPDPSTAPTFKMACPHRKKRSALVERDCNYFDRVYINELAALFNLEKLDHQQYSALRL